MITVRPFTADDWGMLGEWWAAVGGVRPEPDMIPPETSFIAEADGVPMVFATIFFTNSSTAYVEHLIGNPKADRETRKNAVEHGAEYLVGFARAFGFKRLFCMADKAALVDRYKELGFTPTLSGVTTLVRSVENA